MQTQTNTIRVVAAVVDTRQLTLYKEDGETLSILQGDPRLAEIVSTITPILAAGPGSVAEISLPGTSNAYRAYEESSGGFVRLFRVAKSSLAKLFTGTKEQPVIQVDPLTLGAVPGSGSNIPVMDFITRTPVQAEAEARAKLLAATQEIIAHATPVSAEGFDDSTVGQQGADTIVAVVDNQVIAGIEKLKPQLANAASLGSTKGLDAFMRRLAAVITQRRHSVDDLMTFLERGDLPIADDGSIVIYKVLRRRDQDTYVDCHTGKVTQKVGSYVCMSPELVDHDRRNECSNGLHVARRAYIGGFSGDVVVLAKVAPEDVIAVPNYDANKMRVCGYHILFELSDEAFTKLKGNLPFTDTEDAQLLLGRALAGDHIGKLEEVRITGHQGNGVVITSLKVTPAPTPPVAKAVKAKALTEEGKLDAPPVDPRAVSKQVIAAKAAVESRAEKAKRLYAAFSKARTKKARQEAALVLLDHKKSVKLGWLALGLPAVTGEILQQAFDQQPQ